MVGLQLRAPCFRLCDRHRVVVLGGHVALSAMRRYAAAGEFGCMAAVLLNVDGQRLVGVAGGLLGAAQGIEQSRGRSGIAATAVLRGRQRRAWRPCCFRCRPIMATGAAAGSVGLACDGLGDQFAATSVLALPPVARASVRPSAKPCLRRAAGSAARTASKRLRASSGFLSRDVQTAASAGGGGEIGRVQASGPCSNAWRAPAATSLLGQQHRAPAQRSMGQRVVRLLLLEARRWRLQSPWRSRRGLHGGTLIMARSAVVPLSDAARRCVPVRRNADIACRWPGGSAPPAVLLARVFFGSSVAALAKYSLGLLRTSPFCMIDLAGERRRCAGPGRPHLPAWAARSARALARAAPLRR
jgi:hypothetical protein